MRPNYEVRLPSVQLDEGGIPRYQPCCYGEQPLLNEIKMRTECDARIRGVGDVESPNESGRKLSAPALDQKRSKIDF